MKTLRAKKDIYFEHRMIRVGQIYPAEDHIAVQHIRTGKAVEYVPHQISKAEDRRTKVGRPKKTKEE
jgi:hypothetical protein